MQITEARLISSRRKLFLRDSLTFFVLTLATIVLFVLTLLLFRSFTTHQADLAVRWAARGEAALKQGHPDQAVPALRTALIYAPETRSYQMMLAQALGDSGHVEEATNYFLNLWEAQPGEGVINLQLARLARRGGAKDEAIRYYRAAIFGNWGGEGVERRRDARLELANYLIEQGNLSMAQTELLIAASNAPPGAGLEILFGDELVRASDPTNALLYYQKAIAQDPRNPMAYEKAGRLAYQMGGYVRARNWLEHAVRESGGTATTRAIRRCRDMMTSVIPRNYFARLATFASNRRKCRASSRVSLLERSRSVSCCMRVPWWHARRPAAVRAASFVRRSPGSGLRATRPSASRRSTSCVIFDFTHASRSANWPSGTGSPASSSAFSAINLVRDSPIALSFDSRSLSAA